MFKSLPLIPAILLFSASAEAQQQWKQNIEVQPAQERGTLDVTDAPAKPTIDGSVFSGGVVPKWIWGQDNAKNYVLRTTVELGDIKAGRLRASCDNVGTVFVNGKRVGSSSEWQEPIDADVTAALVDGTNVIEAEVQNEGGVAAFVLKLAVQKNDGSLVEVVSDETWHSATKLGEESSTLVALRGTYGDGPWKSVFDNAAIASRVPAGTFELLPGFQVEKLFTVPKDELGSWVCIAFDNKGRLLASDQGDKGICRITLPSLFGRAAGRQPSVSNTGGSESERAKSQEATRRADAQPLAELETKVERLDFSKCEFQPSGAQGMLWAFDSLYFSCNGGPGSGLYRARDNDGDDVFDECVKLKEFGGGGEHGPHSIRLSPDGKRIFVIAGNHTQPPFKAGEELTNKDYTSRVPTNWGEDLLLPRMWDANGHARGVMAPGGWIASTDPDGKTWDIFSVGYRNPYDMAFNADGELFAYDADMEWDVGMPWYRPTRVVHATSGSEFGWRSGSGKWPTYYIDSLPPLVNIGPGSPVGVDFGYGLKFPAKYQKALFCCDWTFGTMYAIHTEPNMSTYKGTKEEFLSRTPLPLTDVAAGPDGALYFSVGGRGTQSELFRVTYVGTETHESVETRDLTQERSRQLRKTFEQFHSRSAREGKSAREINEILKQSEADPSDRKLLPLMLTTDPAFLYAVQNLQAHGYADQTLDATSGGLVVYNPDALYNSSTAVAVSRGNRQDLKETVVKHLLRINASRLSPTQRLWVLRAFSLVAIRLEGFSDETSSQLIQQLDPLFPSNNDNLNRELCEMLVYLKSPTVIEKTVALLAVEAEGREPSGDGGPGATQSEGSRPSASNLDEPTSDLLARNRGYAGDILRSIEKAPDQQQIWYAFCLRNMKEGWTMDQRKSYFAWFERAHTWAGGASFHGFLNNIERECFDNASEKERLLIEASGARKAYAPPEIPKPAGPGKDWTLDEVRSLAKDSLKGRNFENGQKMFAATRCVICHRFGGDGGATGPDLTQLAGRFNLNDLTEAIMDPSKVISDQYKASTIVTTDGKSYSGRIVAENDDTITILTSPEDPTKITEIAKSDIEETLPSAVSIMPADLLKPLNQDEVMDLLAYLLSRGDKGNAMFRK